MRVAHIGNIAANAYLMAKFQRRLGIEADSFDTGSGNPMWVPWWEDSDLDPTHIHPSHYDWLPIAAETGFRRPSWAKILGVLKDAPWYDTQEEYQADLPRLMAGAVHGEIGIGRPASDAEIAAALAESRLSPAEQQWCARGVREFVCWRSIREIARHYDLVVLYGPFAACGAVLPRDVPYITFEHSTMRLVPLLDKPERALLAAAYRHADHNVITNADCREAAWCLDLDPARLSFIPHPVQTDFFTPDRLGRDEQAALVRRNIFDRVEGGAEVIFFAPARQSSNAQTGAKRNDRVFYAFRRYLDEAEPQGAPRAVLVAGGWGDGAQVAESAGLVHALGLLKDFRVQWLSAQPKARMRSLYRACDVVLDQFDTSCGSFGTVTAEALSCGKPVITHVSEAAHEWCADRMPVPPVCNAATTQEVYGFLLHLARNANLRAEMSRRGRAWIEQYHGWERVARDHLALYERVLAQRDEARAAESPGNIAPWDSSVTEATPAQVEVVAAGD